MRGRVQLGGDRGSTGKCGKWPGGRKEAQARRAKGQVTRAGPRALAGRPHGPHLCLVLPKGRELGEFFPNTLPVVGQGPLRGQSLLIPAPKATELEMCTVEASGTRKAGGRVGGMGQGMAASAQQERVRDMPGKETEAESPRQQLGQSIDTAEWGRALTVLLSAEFRRGVGWGAV